MTPTTQNLKVYVRVNADFDEDGVMQPKSLTWEDGHTYPIDKVTGCKPGYSQKAGGQGDCFSIIVQGQRRKLFFERLPNLTGPVIGRWFVERRTV